MNPDEMTPEEYAAWLDTLSLGDLITESRRLRAKMGVVDDE